MQELTALVGVVADCGCPTSDLDAPDWAPTTHRDGCLVIALHASELWAVSHYRGHPGTSSHRLPLLCPHCTAEAEGIGGPAPAIVRGIDAETAEAIAEVLDHEPPHLCTVWEAAGPAEQSRLVCTECGVPRDESTTLLAGSAVLPAPPEWMPTEGGNAGLVKHADRPPHKCTAADDDCIAEGPLNGWQAGVSG